VDYSLQLPITVKKLFEGLDVIVGGMGVDISSVGLVSAVANHPSKRMSGSLSATGLADVYARLLQLGDPGGEVRRAFDAFKEKVPALADSVEKLFKQYFIEGGKEPGAMFRGPSIGGMTPPRDVQVLTIAATFAHIWRAKQAAPGRPIGVNFLRKIERVLLYGFYGAVLAEADWVVMGAGDPSAAPGILDALAKHEPVELPVQVATVPLGEHKIRFEPRDLVGDGQPDSPRPAFVAIVSSHLQAEGLAANPKTRPDAFVIEGPDAGGHNAPPRAKKKDERGNYIYGEEDIADLEAVKAVGIPFFVAGGRGRPYLNGDERLPRQIGTLFALSSDSGMEPGLRERALKMVWKREMEVVASSTASPSTYPFKVAQVPGTVADPEVYAARERRCNMGHLRGYRPKDGTPVGLCPADKQDAFKKSGGPMWRTSGAFCLCNGLMAACGLGQPGEPPLLTLGDLTPVRELQRKLKRMDYSAAEAADYLMGTL
jgi:NAD(P)H-dependent flavin oxidoreductase YrpB (nitropropane dioxygenase family)